MKTVTTSNFGAASPYTPQNLDIAITHLERVLCSEGADSFFAHAYWLGRVIQAHATPGLVQAQQERLQRLLDRLGTLSKDVDPWERAA